jgi:hypothetical protein
MFGCHVHQFACLLLLLCTKIPTTAFTAHKEFSNSLDLPSALKYVKESIAIFQNEEMKLKRDHEEQELLMSKLESKCSPRISDFDADAFDMATDKCASKTCTPFDSDIYSCSHNGHPIGRWTSVCHQTGDLRSCMTD